LRRQLGVVGLAMLVILVISVLYAPWSTTGPVLCPLRLATGIPCPGCGLTRSFCAMARGDLHHAFQFHLLGPLLFLATMVAVPLMLYQWRSGRRVNWFISLMFSTRVAGALAIALIGFHVVRLLQLASTGALMAQMHHSWLGRLWNVTVG